MKTNVILQSENGIKSKSYDLAPEKIIEVLDAYVGEQSAPLSDDKIVERIKALRPEFYAVAEEENVINDNLLGVIRLAMKETGDELDGVICNLIPAVDASEEEKMMSELLITVAFQLYTSRKNE